jgi:hypothetical protein
MSYSAQTLVHGIEHHRRELVYWWAALFALALAWFGFSYGYVEDEAFGITRPGVIPCFNDPHGTLRWARAQGARYWISADQPEPGAVQVFSTPIPFLGWTFERSKYRSKDLVTVYRLAEK